MNMSCVLDNGNSNRESFTALESLVDCALTSDPSTLQPSPFSTPSTPTRQRPKVSRKRINPKDTAFLLHLFNQGRVHFPTREQREALAKQLGLSTRTVQVWFQNRRQACRNRMRDDDHPPTHQQESRPSPKTVPRLERRFSIKKKDPDRDLSKGKMPIRWMKPIVVAPGVHRSRPTPPAFVPNQLPTIDSHGSQSPPPALPSFNIGFWHKQHYIC